MLENANLSPTEGVIGAYEAQFNAIRQLVCSELQEQGAEYCMAVQKLVRTCLSGNLEIANLAELHCHNLQTRFNVCRAKLASHTNSNAMFAIGDNMLMVNFDLGKPANALQSAKFMKPATYDSQIAVAEQLLLLQQIKALLVEPISEASIAIPYNQCMSQVANARKQLNEIKASLAATIESRAFTAFEFTEGLSLYTLNFSDDMSMLFWDRYTITEQTVKSYYVEQHCIVEHVVTGDIEPEKFIYLHKPSKNSMARFLAERLVCLTELIRPEANTEAGNSKPIITVDVDEDEPFTEEELRENGWTEEEIIEYLNTHAN